MWYAIGYEEVLGHDGAPAPGHMGQWRVIAGPHTNPRAASLALGKALVSARGAAPRLHAAYTTCFLVHEREIELYNLFPLAPHYEQAGFDVVAE